MCPGQTQQKLPLSVECRWLALLKAGSDEDSAHRAKRYNRNCMLSGTESPFEAAIPAERYSYINTRTNTKILPITIYVHI